MRGGECPVIPPVHWKGVALPRQRSSRTLKTLSSWTDQLDGPAGRTSWTDQVDRPVLFIRSFGQFAYTKIGVSVCTMSQLPSPMIFKPKRRFLDNVFRKKILTILYLLAEPFSHK